MRLRRAGKLGWIAGEITAAIGRYFYTVARAPKATRRAARAAWLHRVALRLLRILGGTVAVSGSPPRHGLLVANHLSYLDILVIAATVPAVFVSKAEVRGWPLFGWLAARAGTIFIARDRRLQVGQVNRAIRAALDDGALVVIFPEGQSSNGVTVLPFHSSLLEPALAGGFEISVARLRYELPDGDAANEVCYWGEHRFVPHVLHLLGKKSLRATLHFAPWPNPVRNRKALAKQLREAVLKL